MTKATDKTYDSIQELMRDIGEHEVADKLEAYMQTPEHWKRVCELVGSVCRNQGARIERLEQALREILRETIAFDERFQHSDGPEEYGTETIAEIGVIAEKALEEKE